MSFRIRLTPLIAVTILAMSSPSPAPAAGQCGAAEWREFSSLINRVNINLRRFENARVKEICSAGRPLLASLLKADSWIRRHPKCTMATARDRSAVRKISSAISHASAEFRRGCGR
ncbi:MAG: hypothetical protein AB7F74_06895 [Parvibaculaceae bacterium]